MLIAVLFKIRLSVVIGAVRTEIEYVPEVKFVKKIGVPVSVLRL